MQILLLVNWVFILLQLVLVVLFLVLMERKVISYVAIRKGPKKVSFLGWFQSISDALKLMLKEMEPNLSAKKKFFIFGPVGSLLLILLSWFCVSFNFQSFSYIYGSLVIFCLMSLQMYILLVVSWGGKSKYSLLGGLRASAQIISYEISFFFLVFVLVFFYHSYNVSNVFSGYKKLFWLMNFIIGCWLITCLAETNRSPFDFAEGESELVSGFKIEYGALQFAFLYLSEYGSIMLLSMLTMILFMKNKMIFTFIMVNFIIVFFIWIRATLPRFRYDLLMNYTWMGILPVMLLFLLFLILF